MDHLEFTKHITEVHERLLQIANDNNIPLLLTTEVWDPWTGWSYTSVVKNLDIDSTATAIGNITRFVLKKATS